MGKKSISKVIAFIKDNILDVLYEIDIPYLTPKDCKLDVSSLKGTYGSSFLCSLSFNKGYSYVYELAQLEESLCNRFDKRFFLHLDFEDNEISFILDLSFSDIENKFENTIL